MQMFDNLPNIEKFRPRIEKKVKLYVTDLKKADRIMWICKLLKIWYYKRAELDGIITKAERLTLESKVKLDKSTLGGRPDLDVLYDSLRHYLSLNIASITNYEFKTQSVDTVMKSFDDAEKEWKEKNGIGSVPESGKKIVEFPDGSAWFNLGVASCSIEGKAMGHCGNEGDPQPGDNVLSYRTPTKTGSWTPHLTFILTKSGYISEMKGRGNEKPAAKYHPQIIKLLESPIVKGIKGGGYLPEHNFTILDLTEAERERLIKEKPTLFSEEDKHTVNFNQFLEITSTYQKTKDAKTLETIKYILPQLESSRLIHLLKDERTPGDVLALVFLDTDMFEQHSRAITRLALANPSMPKKILKRAFGLLTYRADVCLNKKCPESFLAKAATTDDEGVLEAVIHNKATPNPIRVIAQNSLRTLQSSPDYESEYSYDFDDEDDD